MFHFVFILYTSYLNYNHILHVAFTVVYLISLSRTFTLPCIFLIPFTMLTALKSLGQLFCRISYISCLIVSETFSTLAERCIGGIVSETCITAEGWHHTLFSFEETGSLWNSQSSGKWHWDVGNILLPDGYSILQWSLPYQLSHWWLQNGDFLNSCILC